MRIIQLSDIHVWRYSYNPFHLFNKRVVGTASLLAGRASKFRLERLDVGRRAGPRPRRRPHPDHRRPDHDRPPGRVPATPATPWPTSWSTPIRVTVIPGNHDRYTDGSVRYRQFEKYFGDVRPVGDLPLAPPPRPRHRDPRPRPDPSPHLGPRLPAARANWRGPGSCSPSHRNRPRRLIVACHYPVYRPAEPRRRTAGRSG